MAEPVETPPVETPPVETPPVETPPVETPPVEEKPDAGSKDGKADEDELDGAPETYEDFVMPDGVEADKEVLGKFAELAKEYNLSQDKAQKLVDLQTQMMSNAAKAQASVWETTQDKWVASAEKDEEFGGEKFEENIGIAKKALDAFGTPEFKTALDTTGTGNHPEFLRFLWKVGKAIGDDSIRLGKAGANPPKTAAAKIFPDQK